MTSFCVASGISEVPARADPRPGVRYGSKSKRPAVRARLLSKSPGQAEEENFPTLHSRLGSITFSLTLSDSDRPVAKGLAALSSEPSLVTRGRCLKIHADPSTLYSKRRQYFCNGADDCHSPRWVRSDQMIRLAIGSPLKSRGHFEPTFLLLGFTGRPASIRRATEPTNRATSDDRDQPYLSTWTK
jgi:hypothetical protein